MQRNRPSSQLMATVTDSRTHILAKHHFLATKRILLVEWLSYVTDEEVVQVMQETLRLQQQLRVRGLICDVRGWGGNYEEALPWLVYEWLPNSLRAGARGLAFVVGPTDSPPPAYLEFAASLQGHLPLQVFMSMEAAQQWLRTLPAIPKAEEFTEWLKAAFIMVSPPTALPSADRCEVCLVPGAAGRLGDKS